MSVTSRKLRRAALLGSLSLSALAFAVQSAAAADATWLPSPPTNDFNFGGNWDTASVPGATNIATFDASDTNIIAINHNTTVGEFQFTSGASIYVFDVTATAGADSILTLGTNGIVNSNVPDTIPVFILTGNGAHSAGLTFATAGGAGNAVILGSASNSSVVFTGNTTADTAYIDVAAVSFSGNASASFAQITSRSSLSFTGNATAANAFIDNRGTGVFSGSATVDSAVIFNSGSLFFVGTATGGTGSIVEGSSAILDISGLGNGGLTIGSVTGGGQIALGANFLDTGSDDSSGTVSAVISGSGGQLIKSGNGTLTLTGNNSYTGVTTISGGTLQVGNGGASGTLGSGAVGGSGALVFDRSDSVTVANAIGGSVSLTQAGSGTVILTGANTYSGATTINSGASLQIGAGGTAGTIGATAITDNGHLIANHSDSLTFASAISGSGTFQHAGSGTVILTADNTYSGGTSITGNGTLMLGNGTATGSIVGNVAIGGSGVLNFNRSATLTYAGIISGTGSVQQTGSGAITLSGANTYSGTTTVGAASILRAGAANTFSANSTVIDSGTLDLNNFNQTIAGLSGNGLVTLGSATLTTGGGAFGGVISGTGGVTVSGATPLVFGADNTYTGLTTVSSGATLQLGTGGATGSIASTAVTDNGTLIVDRSNSVTLAGDISGTGQLQQTGTGTTILTGTDTYGGGTTISAGTLQIGNGGAAGSIAGNVTDNGSLAFDRSDAVTFAGVISGSGSVQQIGTGTTTLTGTDTYGGGTTISAGTLQIGGGGTAGSITGNVTDNGALVFNRSDSVTFAGTISGSGSVMQAGTGTTTLTGTDTYNGGTTISAGTLQIGSGGTAGAIAGNVTDNGALIFNRSDSVTFAGTISGSGSVTQAGSGTTILTADNTYGGGTTISAGTLQLGNGGASGLIGGNVADNGTLSFDRSDAIVFAGIISGSGAVKQIGTGTTTLTATNTYSGTTTISAGTLQIGNGGATGSVAGAIVDNAALILNRSDNLTFANLVSGSGTFTKAGTNAVILTANNTYSGLTTISGGSLQLGNGGATGLVAGAIVDNGTLIADRSDTVTLGSVISGTGGLSQIGAGNTILSAIDTYLGGTTVTAGTLTVNGSITSVVTLNGGTLKGTGTVGGIGGSGIVAPGNSIGTLNVAGNASLGASTYQVEVNSTGASDKIAATGQAFVTGGTVAVTAAPGPYAGITTYHIVTATGGVVGTFSSVSVNLATLTPSLVYSAGAVDLVLMVNNIDFGPIAQTPNQIATAAAVKAGGAASAVYAAILLQQPATAFIPAALDALSGEIHPTLRTAMVQDAGTIRQAIVDRLRVSSNGVTASHGTTLWVRGFGGWGSADSNGNAGAMGHNFSGALAGIDTHLSSSFTLGVAGGYSHSHVSVNRNSSLATADALHIGTYAGWVDGNLALRMGAEFGWSDTTVTRAVVFPGFSNMLSDVQADHTSQVFGEAGYAISHGWLAAEPFADFAWVQASTGAFHENGGPAALVARGQATNVTFGSLGMRFAGTPMGSHSISIEPTASVAWQHTFGGVLPSQTMTFVATNQNLMTAGIPLDRDAANVQASLDILLAPSARISVGYQGELSSKIKNHTLRADFSWTF